MAQTPEEKAAAKAAKDAEKAAVKEAADKAKAEAKAAADAEKAAAKAAKDATPGEPITVKYRDHAGEATERTFSKEVHGENFAAVADEFKATNASRIVA